jgi:hypothetical protein
MIRGTSVYLARFDAANAEQARAWLNDPDVNEWMLSGQLPVSRAQEVSFFELTERQWNEGSAYRFEIHAADDGRLIGICGLDSTDLVHRHAEVGSSSVRVPTRTAATGATRSSRSCDSASITSACTASASWPTQRTSVRSTSTPRSDS